MTSSLCGVLVLYCLQIQDRTCGHIVDRDGGSQIRDRDYIGRSFTVLADRDCIGGSFIVLADRDSNGRSCIVLASACG